MRRNEAQRFQHFWRKTRLFCDLRSPSDTQVTGPLGGWFPRYPLIIYKIASSHNGKTAGDILFCESFPWGNTKDTWEQDTIQVSADSPDLTFGRPELGEGKSPMVYRLTILVVSWAVGRDVPCHLARGLDNVESLLAPSCVPVPNSECREGIVESG